MILKFVDIGGQLIGYGSVCEERWNANVSRNTLDGIARAIGIRLGIISPKITLLNLYVETGINYDTLLARFTYIGKWIKIARIYKL